MISHAYTPTGQPASVTDNAGTTVTEAYLERLGPGDTATRPGRAIELGRVNNEGTAVAVIQPMKNGQ